MKRIALTLFFCLLLIGCGFHLRSPRNFPAYLHTLDFYSDNVYQGISVELERLLRASHVQLDPHARIRLVLRNSRFTTTVPVVFSSSSAQIYAYYLSVDVSLEKDQRVIAQTKQSVSQTVTYNVNQVGTPEVTPLMRERLSAQLIEQIYAYLTSASTQQLLVKNHDHPAH